MRGSIAILVVLGLAGCDRVQIDYRAKFDQMEAANRQHPGMGPVEVETILGRGENIPHTHPDLAGGPPGIGRGADRWMRWEGEHEVLLVGYAGECVSSVVRLRR
jgi:hypothetical protein